MGGVILPGASKPRGALQIIVPRSVTDEANELVGHCLVPGCGARFYKGQEIQWQRHVGECARRNIDRIRAATAPRGPSILHEDFDPEATAYLRDVGRRMLREGRLEMRPNERIVDG
jgi:hypothetical protein